MNSYNHLRLNFQDMEFSSDLLKSFMEDLEAFTEDVAKANKPAEMADCCERILSLIQVQQLIISKNVLEYSSFEMSKIALPYFWEENAILSDQWQNISIKIRPSGKNTTSTIVK